MSNDDMANFKLAVENHNSVAFVEKYMSDHKDRNISSEEDVYTLALMRAIGKDDLEFTKHLLLKADHSGSVLVNMDYYDASPIYVALLSGNDDILSEISKYLDDHKFETKFRATGFNLHKIISAVSSPGS